MNSEFCLPTLSARGKVARDHLLCLFHKDEVHIYYRKNNVKYQRKII